SYYSDTFNINDYDELKSIRRIDASSVDHDLSITGNKYANVITGAAGNNTINGSKGNDTLYGGDGGANTYIYNNGDGNDIIYGFDSDDVLRIESGVLSGDYRVNGNTVIFTVGKGKISLNGTAGDPITIWYDGDFTTRPYPDNLIMDDDIAVSDSDLSSIVRDGASSPYSLTRSGEYLVFTMDNNSSLPALAYSEKK
ncbi:MAG: hypothetical protein J5497_08845, partial [Selenomonadaceae bacterium]|nr:hypothetical protein [Selenomonadaceae bacterium]